MDYGKTYLEVEETGNGLAIRVRKEHATELEALYRQSGVACRRQQGDGPDFEVLVFDGGADADKVRAILESHKSVKGS